MAAPPTSMTVVASYVALYHRNRPRQHACPAPTPHHWSAPDTRTQGQATLRRFHWTSTTSVKDVIVLPPPPSRRVLGLINIAPSSNISYWSIS
eukprot:g43183.t1